MWTAHSDLLLLLLLLLLTVTQDSTTAVGLLTMLGPTALQTVAGLSALLLADRFILKRVFEVHPLAAVPR